MTCLLVYTSCKYKDAPATAYLFELPSSISPQQDTFRIGDTIKISSSFGSELEEANNRVKHKFEDFDFHFGLYVSKIDSFFSESSESIYPSLVDFKILYDTLQKDFGIQVFRDGDKSVNGFYNKIGSGYSLSIDLIPQKKGLYFLRFGVGCDSFGKQDFEGRCKNRGLDFDMILNGSADSNNSEYLYESPIEHFNTWMPQKLNARYYDLSGYCFYVV